MSGPTTWTAIHQEREERIAADKELADSHAGHRKELKDLTTAFTALKTDVAWIKRGVLATVLLVASLVAHFAWERITALPPPASAHAALP